MKCPKCGRFMRAERFILDKSYICTNCRRVFNEDNSDYFVKNEMLTVGRSLSERTLSGTQIDFNIPDFNDNLDTSINLVKRALLEVLDQHDDIALLLSGGKDSRMLACLLKQLNKRPTCYTYILRHNNYEENELNAAKNVAKALNFPHKTLDIPFHKFYDRDLITKIITESEGVPKFHSLLTMGNIRPLIPEKYIITGDLITELLDTSEYRPWKDGRYIRRTLFNQEKITRLLPFYKHQSVIHKLQSIYTNTPINLLLLTRKSDRLVRRNIYHKFRWNVIHPALDEDVLSHTFSLPIRKRTDGYLPQKIIKQTNHKLYTMKTARSPFSLRVPLSIHILYAQLFHQSIQNTPIPGQFNNSIKNKPKLEKYRLDNYLWWKHIHGKD